MVRFALVGSSGLLVNAALLVLLIEGLGWPVLIASLLSIEASTISNWALNRSWTWRDRRDVGPWTSLGQYHAVAVGGMAIQWAVLAVTVHSLGVHYLVASVLGVGVGALWNYLGNDRLVFALQDAPSSRVRRGMWYAASLLMQLAVAAVLTHPWDTFVFSRSVGDFLVHGITPYEVAAQAPGYIFPGTTLPLTAQWYAYPPLALLLMSVTYAPAAFGLVSDPWAARILLKLPFLLGTLGFAWAARRLVATAPEGGLQATVRADRLERWLLLNPLFIVIAGVWGQFEALLLMMLALMVLALRNGRTAVAGLAYGAALLLKVFPLYVAPVLAIHLVRTRGWLGAVRFGVVAGAVFAALTLPFWLAEPSGTLQQIFLMHAERPPARFAPLAALYLGARWLTLHVAGLPSVTAFANAFSMLSFFLTAVVLGALALASTRRQASERNLVLHMGLAMTGGLLATKVLNEQYTLLPLGLLAIAQFHPATRAAPRLRPLLSAATWAMTFAALVDNVHFLRFLPPDIAGPLLGQTVPAATRDLAAAFGLQTTTFQHVLGFITGLGLLVPLVLGVRLVAPPLRDGLALAAHALERVPALVRGHLPGRTLVTLGTLVALVVLPIAAAINATPNTTPSNATPELGARSVLVDIRADWYNPTNEPTQAAGTWQGIEVTPAAGFYNSNARKAVDDLVVLRIAGVDGVLVRVNPDYVSGALALRRVAESVGMPYAPRIDVAPLADADGRVPVTALTASAVAEAVPAEWWAGQWHMRAAGSRLVVVDGAASVVPGFTPAEVAFALQAYVHARAVPETDPSLQLAASQPPDGPEDLAGEDAVATLWREAYQDGLRRWWKLAVGDPVPGPAAAATDHRVPASGGLAWMGDLPVAGGGARHRWSAMEGPVSAATARDAWVAAVSREPTAVVVPWNDFGAGRAVEPTDVQGDLVLRALASWVADYHAGVPGPTQAPPPEPGGNLVQRVVDAVEELLPPWRNLRQPLGAWVRR